MSDFVRVRCPDDGWTVRVRARGVSDNLDTRPWLKTRAERKGCKAKRARTCGQSRHRFRRDRVFARTRGVCQFSGCPAKATEIHHVIPLRDGGTNALRNLQGLCYSHARAVHPEQNPRWSTNKSHGFRKRNDHEGLYPAIGLPAAFA